MGPNVPAESGDLRVIRPLIYVPEELIRNYAEERAYAVSGECIYKEQLIREGDRPYFARLLEELSARIPDLRSNMLRSLSNIQASHLLDRKFTQTLFTDSKEPDK